MAPTGFQQPSLPLSLLLIAALASQPARAFDVGEWLRNPPYHNGGTIKEQIQCYALPYGAIGFASHVLTYLTVFCLSTGRNPLMPWAHLAHRRFNLIIATIGFLVSFPLTVLTMVRCRNSWSFILIAVWKLVLSVTLTSMTIHAARMIVDFHPHDAADAQALLDTLDDEGKPLREQLQYRKQFRDIWWWAFFYFLGAVVGFVGVMNIVGKNIGSNHQLQIVTGVFGGVIGFIVMVVATLTWLAFSWSDESKVAGAELETGAAPQDKQTGVVGKAGWSFLAAIGVGIFILTIMFAFYTDWALAALAEDLVGHPSSENAVFYWTYFAAKRIPMLSF
ncbi:hypothetical protein B0T22DRAFT_445037 [Podospora appendiculata]|uniref:Uncharacterized protein n=1 Tax=Podospora appendiculata TaxID=314037 RepID=A0AAE0X1K3_9PEZI|nr:hypothetical protein B0T22DRAFT_445037 [Podospora appendiculata]